MGADPLEAAVFFGLKFWLNVIIGKENGCVQRMSSLQDYSAPNRLCVFSGSCGVIILPVCFQFLSNVLTFLIFGVKFWLNFIIGKVISQWYSMRVSKQHRSKPETSSRRDRERQREREKHY